MEYFFTVDSLVSLLTLTVMEIILGIDNIVFISIIAGKLPQSEQKKAWYLGLGLAFLFRVLLLLSITWIIRLKDPIFEWEGLPEAFLLSWRDVILIGGGLFLMWKTVTEMHHRLEGEHGEAIKPEKVTFGQVLFQIVLLDMVFSFDSILTAVGLVSADKVLIMILAVMISMAVMLAAANAISTFVNRHPSIKMLALSFLLLIGFMLVAEGFEQHVEKGYIYFAMAFSLGVELLNIRMRRKSAASQAVQLRQRIAQKNDAPPATPS